MAMRFGPFRFARWGSGYVGAKGVAVTWLSRRLLLNLEFHYEWRKERR